MITKDAFRFSSTAATIFVIVLSFAATVMLWLFTDSRVDYLNDAREQVRILIGSWDNLEGEITIPPSDANTAKSAYNLVIFDVRLNNFLKSPLAKTLSRSALFENKLNELDAEWPAVREKIESCYARVPSDNDLSESELSIARLRFSVLLDGMADIISDKIIQQTVQARLIVFVISVIIVLTVVFFINEAHKRIWPHHLELERLTDQQANELEKAKAAAENAKLQTEQINRQLQASVNHANLMAQQVIETNQSKNEFMANISREIRIPMNAIMGFSEMLAEENLTEQQKKQVGIIRDSCRQLLQLINDVLDYSKIETGKLEVEIVDCNVENFLDSIESAGRAAAAEKKVRFEIVRNEPLPEVIRTDSARLKQCLMSLINNAIESTNKGAVTVRIFQISDKSLIRFDVEDMGGQISSEKLKKVFEPFSQTSADNARSRRSGSNGMRLAVARHIAEILGGSVLAAGKADEGAIFTLILPFNTMPAKTIQNHPANIATNSSASVSADSIQFTGKVLVAEDTPTNQILISLLLKKLGIEPVIVENGSQAVKKVMTEKFDMIFMDIQMPVMNGYEATQQLRKKGVKIPIVAQTACAMKGDDEKCFAAGCDDYIPKPIDKQKLIQILAKYLPYENKMPAAKPIVSEQQKQPMQSRQPAAALSGTGESEIDWQLLVERIGNEQFVAELMPVFIKDNDERIKMLEKAIADDDDKEVKFYAHSIKGASGTIGATAISDLARQLEDAARDSDKSKYKPLFEEIKARFTRLTEFVSQSNWREIASSRRPTKKV